MIVRIWGARAPSVNALKYISYFNDAVVPHLNEIDGFLGATLTRHDDRDDVHFLVMTRWRSMESIEAFAGADVTAAVVPEPAAALLTDYDRIVHHYFIVEEIQRAP